ncbi:MAG TPA: hypothetical protein VFB91_06270 [Terriglobales bacterium]|nr:hypothetical protein [Terriglobales bacterium]
MMKAGIEDREKMAALLKEAEDSPIVKTLRAEKAAAILATRKEAAGKIEAAKKEREEVIPELLADRDAKEENFKRAKAALETAGGEYQTARVAVSSRSQSFDSVISRQEAILFETADPLIDAALTFFREKLDWLRTPGRISIDRRGAESNIFTEKITTTVESNRPAILSALRYCQEAVAELERMKLAAALDLQKIEGMKKGIPDIGVFSESANERPMPGIPPMIIPRFGGAASDEYEQTLLDRVHKKAKDFLSKPAGGR